MKKSPLGDFLGASHLDAIQGASADCDQDVLMYVAGANASEQRRSAPDAELLFDFQELGQLRLIEPDDQLVVHQNDRHAELSAFLHHLLALGHVGSHVESFELDIVLLEIVLCHIAIMAGRRGIYGYFFHDGGC
jgi:hypothetical protein